MNRDALAALRDDPLDWRYKGFPPATGRHRRRDRARRAGTCWPATFRRRSLVLKESALAHNLALMQRYCDERGASLAPHGKTTMSPAAHRPRSSRRAPGAITAANVAQVRVFRAFGVQRIVLANELRRAPLGAVGRGRARPRRRLRLLLPRRLARRGARDASRRSPTGSSDRSRCSSSSASRAAGPVRARSRRPREVAAAVASSAPCSSSPGSRATRGSCTATTRPASLDQVDAFLDRMRELLLGLRLERDEVRDHRRRQRVLRPRLRSPRWTSRARLVLRGGCYVTHDSGYYEHLSPLGGRVRRPAPAYARRSRPGAPCSRGPSRSWRCSCIGKRDVCLRRRRSRCPSAGHQRRRAPGSERDDDLRPERPARLPPPPGRRPARGGRSRRLRRSRTRARRSTSGG